jgi:hypothetical protein
MTQVTKNGRELARAIGRDDWQALEVCSLLARHARTAQNIAEAQCNGHPLQQATPPHFPTDEARKAYWARVDKAQARFEAWLDKRDEQIEKRMRVLVAQLGEGFGLVVGGDPRGCVVKISTPDGRTNDWGREGIRAVFN